MAAGAAGPPALDGNSVYVADLYAPAAVPGKAAASPVTVTTTWRADLQHRQTYQHRRTLSPGPTSTGRPTRTPGVDRPEPDDRGTRRQPDPGHPPGDAALRPDRRGGKRSSWPSLLTKTRSCDSLDS